MCGDREYVEGIVSHDIIVSADTNAFDIAAFPPLGTGRRTQIAYGTTRSTCRRGKRERLYAAKIIRRLIGFRFVVKNMRRQFEKKTFRLNRMLRKFRKPKQLQYFQYHVGVKHTERILYIGGPAI